MFITKTLKTHFLIGAISAMVAAPIFWASPSIAQESDPKPDLTSQIIEAFEGKIRPFLENHSVINNAAKADWEAIYDTVDPLMKQLEASLRKLLTVPELELLARETHNNGYWAPERINTGSPNTLELAATIRQEGVEWLRQNSNEGHKAYVSRYENYDTKLNKLTAQQLGITSVEALKGFLIACGKSSEFLARNETRPLLEKMLTGKPPVMNLLKAPFDVLLNTAERIKNPTAKDIFKKDLVGKQLSAIARTAFIENLEFNHKVWLESTRVFTSHGEVNMRSKLIWLFYTLFGTYMGKNGFGKHDILLTHYSELDPARLMLDITSDRGVKEALALIQANREKSHPLDAAVADELAKLTTETKDKEKGTLRERIRKGAKDLMLRTRTRVK